MLDLVNALPAKMRQKVLSKEAYESSDDEEAGEGEETSGWGKKKAAYYSADTTDLEIGQDIEDAKDEEEAAMVRSMVFTSFLFHNSAQELRKKTLARMQEDDYFDDLGVETFMPDKSKKSKDKLGQDLEELTLGSAEKVRDL